MTVLRDADRNAKLHRAPGLSLRHPARVRPGYRVHLPAVRDRPALQDPPSGQVRPVPDMADEAPDTVRWARDTQPAVDLRAARRRPVRQLRRQPGGPSPPQARDTSRTMHRAASIGKLRSAGWCTSVPATKE